MTAKRTMDIKLPVPIINANK